MLCGVAMPTLFTRRCNHYHVHQFDSITSGLHLSSVLSYFSIQTSFSTIERRFPLLFHTIYFPASPPNRRYGAKHFQSRASPLTDEVPLGIENQPLSGLELGLLAGISKACEHAKPEIERVLEGRQLDAFRELCAFAVTISFELYEPLQSQNQASDNFFSALGS